VGSTYSPCQDFIKVLGSQQQSLANACWNGKPGKNGDRKNFGSLIESLY